MSHQNLSFISNALAKKKLSKHAEKRSGQRGISTQCLPLVLGFGEREYDGRGGIRYLMTADSISRLRGAVGTTQQVENLAGVYAVLSVEDQTVITLGHRYAH
jgi:hypothetical protein